MLCLPARSLANAEITHFVTPAHKELIIRRFIFTRDDYIGWLYSVRLNSYYHWIFFYFIAFIFKTAFIVEVLYEFLNKSPNLGPRVRKWELKNIKNIDKLRIKKVILKPKRSHFIYDFVENWRKTNNLFPPRKIEESFLYVSITIPIFIGYWIVRCGYIAPNSYFSYVPHIIGIRIGIWCSCCKNW